MNGSRFYYLTPAGCEATGGHKVHADGGCSTCGICGHELEQAS